MQDSQYLTTPLCEIVLLKILNINVKFNAHASITIAIRSHFDFYSIF